MYRGGVYIPDLDRAQAAMMVYGIMRERMNEEDFRAFDEDLELTELAERDPEAAQEVLNAKMMAE